MAEGPSRPISPEASGDQAVPSRARGVRAARMRKRELERRSSAPSVSAKKEVGKLPTRIEDEPEGFWESLTPEEKKKVMTRHRSGAQLRRAAKGVTEKGGLMLTEKQIERARKEMEKEMRRRKEVLERWESFLGEELSERQIRTEGAASVPPGVIGPDQIPEGARIKREVEAPVVEAEVKEAEAGERLGLRERLEGAVGRFVEGVNDAFKRWAPKVEELTEKAKALGAVAKWSVVALVDGPLWLVRDWRLKAKTKEVKKYKGEIKRDEEIYGEIERALTENATQRIGAAEEILIAQIELLDQDTDTVEAEIREGYEKKIGDSNSKAEKRLRKNQQEADLQALRARRHARARRAQAEMYRYEAEILEEKGGAMEGYLTRYITSVDSLAVRLHSAVEARDKWEERADRSREKVRRLDAALEELSR